MDNNEKVNLSYLKNKHKFKVYSQLTITVEELSHLEHKPNIKIDVLRLPKESKELNLPILETIKTQVINNNGCVIYY